MLLAPLIGLGIQNLIYHRYYCMQLPLVDVSFRINGHRVMIETVSFINRHIIHQQKIQVKLTMPYKSEGHIYFVVDLKRNKSLIN